MTRWPAALLVLLLTLVFQPVSLFSAQDLAGKWHFVLDTEGGDREVDANFQLNGQNVSGTWDKTPVSGTFSDGQLDLSFAITAHETGEQGTLKLTGKLHDDQLTGNWHFSEYQGTFKATRSK
jgi:hypothetical protein